MKYVFIVLLFLTCSCQTLNNKDKPDSTPKEEIDTEEKIIVDNQECIHPDVFSRPIPPYFK